MEEVFSLSALPTGKTALISEIFVTGKEKRRFADLGIIKGSTITAVQRGLFGDPTAYNIKGTIIALRKEDSNKVFVKNVKGT